MSSSPEAASAIPDASAAGLSAFESLRQIYSGYCLARSLHIVADLGVADAVGDTPRTASELAGMVGANPDALHRILRLLASHGVFRTEGAGYAHSEASRLLRSDHPQSARPLARMFGLSLNWSIYGAMAYTVQTGKPATEIVHPEGFWKHFQAHPEESEIFNAAMAAKARAQVASIVPAYGFSGCRRIGDIGGGRGHLLRAVLEAAPQASGILFDLSHVIEDSRAIASPRLELRAGDFFRDALPECDLYLLMEVIHDWPDAESIAILGAIRHAAPRGAKLLLIEEIVPMDTGPHWSKHLDVHMLTLLGGKQRTLEEYEALLRPSGFALRREIPTAAGISILESEAV